MSISEFSKSFTVESVNDIELLFSRVYEQYKSSKTKPSCELLEWKTLASLLKKNITMQLILPPITYPFDIVKQEKPDFILESMSDRLYVEIVRITTKNLEAIVSLCYQTESSNFEPDSRLYNNNVKMKKAELKELIHEVDEPLVGLDMYGDYRERKWAEMCFESVRKKANKNYKINLLVLDDEYVQSSVLKRVEIGLAYLKEMLLESPINPSNIDTIISETHSGLILLYNCGKWLFEYRH